MIVARLDREGESEWRERKGGVWESESDEGRTHCAQNITWENVIENHA